MSLKRVSLKRVALLRGALLLCLLAALRLAVASPWPTQEWTRASPESQGVDSKALVSLVETLAEPRLRTDSVLIVRHGRIVSEAYFAPYEAGLLHDLRSVTKSVLGTLVGVALQRGDLASISQPIVPFFPVHFDAPSGVDPRQRQITIAQLLDMRAGIAWREWPYDARSDVLRMAASPDPVRYMLDRGMDSAPGTRFHYSGAAPHLLSAMITRATGLDAHAYAQRELFTPLGFGRSAWLADAPGNALGESGLSLAPRDLAKIGLLMLRDGVWDGQRLLPAGWMQSLVARAQPHGLATRLGLPPAYAGLWWVDPRVPMLVASGRHGQHLVLLPRHDALMVITAKTDDKDAGALVIAPFVSSRLLPALHDSPLPPDPAAERRLRERLAALTTERPLPGIAPPKAMLDSKARDYQIESNPLGWTRLSLAPVSGNRARLSLQWQAAGPGGTTSGDGRVEWPLSFDGKYVKTLVLAQRPYAVRSAWQDANTLLVELQDLQSSVLTRLKLRFEGDGLQVDMSDGDGLRLLFRGSSG